MAEQAAKILPDIIIHEKMCKSCSICVDFCPTNVLEIKGACVHVRDLDACTRCQLCELRCPDFAIQVSG
jgi:2-oxoglutarate ferredoxin oxidoreductase subunit delta